MAWYIEQGVPGVLYNGLNTQKAVDFTGSSSVALPAFTTTGVVSVLSATAASSGGAAGVKFGSNAIGIYWGSSTPTVAAAQGSIYLRTDGIGNGRRMFINTDGSTTWVAITTAS